ncbi:hypothetical protein C1645_788835 [Glomus cerebriforme]|uniref:SHSP domain-containing protein n=1 Tax=Glomus cerebriforme TaxID=658196 RepID=A0A397SBV0_9GLOM|nr:hypothetical protein C1645_788835 [Glomus cerebriforme]
MSDSKGSSEYRSECCWKSQQSVLVAGEINHISNKAIEKWLKVNSPVDFVHVIKKINNCYGHVHFYSSEHASLFFHKMQKKRFEGPEGHHIYFTAAKDSHGNVIVYSTPASQLPPANYSDKNKLPIQYALYKEDNVFTIVVNTPGINSKDQFKISVDDDDKNLTIIGELPQYKSDLNVIFDNRITGQFSVDIQLPEKIDQDQNVKTEINNGITVFKFRIKNSKKRKFLNIL